MGFRFAAAVALRHSQRLTLPCAAKKLALSLRTMSAIQPGQLIGQLLVPLVERLEPELPAVQLNAELIDIPADFGPLSFVFLQMTLQLGQFGRGRR